MGGSTLVGEQCHKSKFSLCYRHEFQKQQKQKNVMFTSSVSVPLIFLFENTHFRFKIKTDVVLYTR
jgi:hypothetical protein